MHATTQVNDGDVLEAAAVLFQVARAESSSFEEYQINNNQSLRKTLTKRILATAKSLRPDISQEVWHKASEELIQRHN